MTTPEAPTSGAIRRATGDADADVLVVATQRRWVADDFVGPAAARHLPLIHSLGLDVPDLSPYQRPAWWAPTEHAARVKTAGVDLPLLATGPRWLADVPTHLTGRDVWAGPLRAIALAPAAGWAKPAEIKVETLPAAWWNDTADFARAAYDAGLRDDTWVQVTPTRLELTVEHRAFVLAGRVVTIGPYLLADGTTWHEGLDAHPDVRTHQALDFAQACVDELAERQPPAYVLDVAETADGTWVLLEGNPAWSSATYGCDMSAVLDVVTAAADHAGTHPQWQWQPDPWLVYRASRMRPLTVG